MIVISDTTPLNYLILIDEAQILHDLFGNVLIPQAVFNELQRNQTPAQVRRWIANAPHWLERRTVGVIDATLNLGSGEIEAISLAIELKADRILLDDRRARKAAMERGIVPTGTLGLLEEAADKGLIDLTKIVDKLEQTTFRAPAALIKDILDRDAKRKGII